MTTLMVDTGTTPPVQREKRERFAMWRRLPPKAKVGVALLGFFVLIAIIGPTLAPYNPSFQNPNPNLSLNAPSAAHLLGTTQNGQDVFSQLLTGVRMTLELAVIVGIVATAISVIVGISAGYLGGAWDEVLSLLSNVFLVLPLLPLLVVLLGYLPQRGETATILVLAFFSWPWGARVIRAQTLALRNRDFVAASRETGERGWHIIMFEIMPNEVSLIAASFVGTVLYAIGASVALAFIGLADLNTWSLGTMLYWAQSDQALTLGAWWWFVPPGVLVALIGTALVLLNFGIDELGNPRLRSGTGAIKVGGRWWGQTDPTPVLAQANRRPSRVGSFLHSFSRESLTEGPREVAGPLR
jgi:peptide/nickel transport system permease protein